DTLILVAEKDLKIPLERIDVESSVELDYYRNRISLLDAQRQLEKKQLLPDISLHYFQGTNSELNSSLYGYQVGLKIPLLFGGQSSRIKASGIAQQIASQEYNEYDIQLKARYEALMVRRNQLNNALSYYEQEGTALSDEILKTAQGSFKNGEIDFYQFIQSLEGAYEIKLDYLEQLNQYNNVVIEINYLTL
ncbi:TolC family protein, partial [Nonlabens ulvanivorans]